MLSRQEIQNQIEYGPGSCWTWVGSKHPYRAGKHRQVYEALVGPIPDKADLHHRCRRGLQGCVNPDHLVPVSRAQNAQFAFREKVGQMPRKALAAARILHNEITARLAGS